MNKKFEKAIGIIGFLITLFGLFFGDNLYQQFSGHSFLDGISGATRTSDVIEISTIPIETQQPIIPIPATPGIGSIMNSEKDGAILVYIPAGKFTMGSNNGDSDEPSSYSLS